MKRYNSEDLLERSALLFRILSRKREYGSPREWYSKILRTRNSDSLIVADFFGNESEYVRNYF